MTNFDKKERELNVLINEYINCKKDLKWLKEECKLDEERASDIQAELFFLYIDRYLILRENHLLNLELDQEYLEVNK